MGTQGITAAELNRRMIQKRVTPVLAFSCAKCELSWGELRTFIRQFLSPTALLHGSAFGSWRPKSYDSIKVLNALMSGKLRDEARWIYLQIYSNLDEVLNILSEEKTIVGSLLNGDYGSAISNINSFELNHGCCLTTLYYRLFAMERMLGPSAHKKFLSELNGASGNNVFIVIIANYLSVRAEINTSADSLDSELTKLSDQLPAAKVLMAVVRHFADPFHIETERPAKVLDFCGGLPLLDKLLLLRRLGLQCPPWGGIEQFLRSDKKISDAKAVEAFHLCFPKERLLAANSLTEIELRIGEIYSHIESGNNEAAKEICRNLYSQNPQLFEVIEPAMALGILNDSDSLVPRDSCPAHDLITLVRSLLQGQRSERASLGDIRRLASKIPSRDLQFFLSDRFLTTSRDYLGGAAFGYIESGRLSPYLYNGKPSDQALASIVSAYEKQLKATKEEAISIGGTGPLHAFSRLHRIQRLRFASRNTEALALAAGLSAELGTQGGESLPLGLQIEILRLLVQLKLDAGDKLGSIGHAAELMLLGGILPNSLAKRLPEIIFSNEGESFHAYPLTGILLSQLGAEPKKIYPVLDNFLFSNNIKYIENMMDGENHPRLTKAFLELVCILPVLARSPAYQTTLEAENARLRICQFLIREQHSVPRMTAEIAELTQRQLIRKGVSNVKRSKIYVDESGIRRAGDLQFRERYQQFVASRRDGGGNDLKLLDVEQLSLYLPNEAGDLVPKIVEKENIEGDDVKILSHGHFLLFRSFFIDIRNQFVSSNSHGLDSYLSIRIRHGTLQGQLRSPFESLHLILQRLAPGRGYAESEYWPQKLALPVLDDRRQRIHSLLSEFSESIDNAIIEVKDNILHVSTEEKKKIGLFEYDYTEVQLLELLDSDFGQVGSHEQFLDKAFHLLWQRTIDNLGAVRRHIKDTTAAQLRRSLEKLEAGFRQVFQAEDAQELFQSVTRAYAALNIAISTVEDWFQPSSQTTPEALDVRVMAEIAVASYNNIHPHRSTKFSFNSSMQYLMHGRVCTPIYDVVAVMLDNAFAHSQLEPSDAAVSVSFSVNNSQCCIKVDNSLDPAVDIAASVSKINLIGAPGSRAPTGDEVKLEGGTGLPKVLKILRSDLSRGNVLVHANIPADNRISVSAEFETDGLIV